MRSRELGCREMPRIKWIWSGLSKSNSFTDSTKKNTSATQTYRSRKLLKNISKKFPPVETLIGKLKFTNSCTSVLPNLRGQKKKKEEESFV